MEVNTQRPGRIEDSWPALKLRERAMIVHSGELCRGKGLEGLTSTQFM